MKVREITNIIKKDFFGPEHVFEIFDEETGRILGWNVIDNTARGGIGKGGTAMYPTVDLGITLRKARNMTWKEVFCNPVGLETKYPVRGGAKGGICYNPKNPDSREILKNYLLSLGNHEISPGKYVIPDKYIFDLDVGLDEKATRLAVELLGPKSTTAKPRDLGGIPYDELGITGFGLVKALEVICLYAGLNLEKLTMAIQGFGAVGKGIAKHLLKMQEKPKIVAISNSKGTFYNPYGFTLETLESLATEILPLGSELFLDVDILALCYKEDQITLENISEVKAPLLLQGANMGVSPRAEKIHCKRFGPWSAVADFVVNAGAATASLVEEVDGTIEEGFKYVEETITHNTALVIEEAIKQRKTTREVALKIAKDEVKKAMQKRAT